MMALNSPSRKEFNPTDDQLLRLFLYNKVHGKPIPGNITILECDLYGEKNPWEIWQQFGDSHSYGGKDLYFFTTLKKNSPTRSSRRRSVHTIGCGFWEGEDTGKIIVASDTNQFLGIKKRYRFEKSGTQHDGGWILHEYSLYPSLLSDPSAINCVLCRFRKNSKDESSVTRQRKTIVLALASESENNNVRLGGDIFRGARNHLESGGNRTKVVETTTTKRKSEYKEEDGNLSMSWPEIFSMELTRFEGSLIQEEDIPLLPNPFYLDLLLEMIDIKYINSSSK